MGRFESITRRTFLGVPIAFAMQQIPNLNELPPNLPVPKDDGGARHLQGMALPDLEPVTMSEVGTKLDLARAYMDMGDPEGARNILEEVLQEGSVTQKQEAQRLLDSLPG